MGSPIIKRALHTALGEKKLGGLGTRLAVVCPFISVFDVVPGS